MHHRVSYFLLDENVPVAVVPWLKELGLSVEIEHVLYIGLGGKPDRDIYEWAQLNRAVVITFDEDFADLRLFPFGHHGVIRLRVWPTTVVETQNALRRLFEAASIEELSCALTIVDPSKIRIKRAE